MDHVAAPGTGTNGIHAYVHGCCERLADIVQKIQSCDAMLKSRALDPATLQLAHRLLAVIEAELNVVGRNASESAWGHPGSRLSRISEIQGRLLGLDELCDQLVATIQQPSAQPALATV